MHDRGGRPTDAPIDRSEHELADWELLTDAVVGTLGRNGLMNVHGENTLSPTADTTSR